MTATDAAATSTVKHTDRALANKSTLREKLGHVRWRGRTYVEQQYQQLWQFLYRSSGRSRPVFLVGCGRSGTSMLVRQLDKSWQIRSYNEDHAAAFDNYRLRDLDTIERLVASSQAKVTLFKPILSTCQTRMLLSHFVDARILFVFRHYDDVINSSLRRFGIGNRLNHVRAWIADDFAEFAFAPPPTQTQTYIRSMWNGGLTPEEGAALYWLFYNRLYFDLKLVEDERVHLVHYETLVTDPGSALRSLTQFLKIEFEWKMIEGIFATSIGRYAQPVLNDDLRTDCHKLYRRLLCAAGTDTDDSSALDRLRHKEARD